MVKWQHSQFGQGTKLWRHHVLMDRSFCVPPPSLVWSCFIMIPTAAGWILEFKFISTRVLTHNEALCGQHDCSTALCRFRCCVCQFRYNCFSTVQLYSSLYSIHRVQCTTTPLSCTDCHSSYSTTLQQCNSTAVSLHPPHTSYTHLVLYNCTLVQLCTMYEYLYAYNSRTVIKERILCGEFVECKNVSVRQRRQQQQDFVNTTAKHHWWSNSIVVLSAKVFRPVIVSHTTGDRGYSMRKPPLSIMKSRHFCCVSIFVRMDCYGH
jgi:hypothetical protein